MTIAEGAAPAVRIVVLVKATPDEVVRTADGIDRTSLLLAEPDECATGLGVRLAGGPGAEVVAVTMGPAGADRAVRRALELGADRAVHVEDDRLAGADVTTTARVLAAAVRTLGGARLVLAAARSADAGTGVVAAQVGALLGLPVLGRAVSVEVDGDEVVVEQLTVTHRRRLRAPLPALVAVGEALGQPAAPGFAAVLAARRRTVERWRLDDLAEPVTPRPVAATTWAAGPDRGAAVLVRDEGSGGRALVDWLRELDVLGTPARGDAR
ncbi:MAG TPA: electron transfer flavoprotein subunit beta [Cellulomonas sp.]